MRKNLRDLKLVATLFFMLGLFLSDQTGKAPYTPNEDAEWQMTYDWLKGMKQSPKPKQGFVPDAKTATEIGAAISFAMYGEISLRERLLRARLHGSVWTVMGTLNPPGALGSVSIIQIQKDDGRILFAVNAPSTIHQEEEWQPEKLAHSEVRWLAVLREARREQSISLSQCRKTRKIMMRLGA